MDMLPEFYSENDEDQLSETQTGYYYKYLLIFVCLVFLGGQTFEAHWEGNIATRMGVSIDLIRSRGEVWRFFTYMWFHDFLPLLAVNLGVFFLFAPHVEGEWGFPRFLTYYLVCGVAAGASSFLFAQPDGLLGSTGAILGVCVAHLILFPDRKIFKTVPVRYGIWFAMAIMVAGHYWQDNGQDPQGGLAQLGGLVAGWLFIQVEPYVMEQIHRWQRWRRRKKQEKQFRIRQKAEQLLDKISEEGMDELTWKEKGILKKASEIYRESDTRRDSEEYESPS